jgi:hypothetical protein
MRNAPFWAIENREQVWYNGNERSFGRTGSWGNDVEGYT